jgi:orotidine-5'-phosphate decarboxylase
MTPIAPTPIVALDVPSLRAALDLVDRLGAACRFYKVGSELFTAAGPSVIEELRRRDCDVFLDLKFHDIPNTVAGAVRRAAALGVRLITVHGSGGESMLRAAVDAAGASGCGVLAVTVLTSFTPAALAEAWGRGEVDVLTEVLRLAAVAARVGAHGVVCSGLEVRSVVGQFGDRLAVLVPGVRLAGTPVQDQARVVTPGEGAALGARYLILGRAVTGATDPVVAMQAVHAELHPH